LRAILSALEDGDASVRAEALKALGRILPTLAKKGMRDLLDEIAPPLRRLVEKGSPSERLLAMSLLSRAGDKGQLDLMTAWKEITDPEARRLFIEELDGHPEILAQALSDKDPAVRFAAARKLAALGDARAEPVLREALHDGGARALQAYGLLAGLKVQGQLPAGEELYALFEKASAEDRLSAVDAISRLPVDKARELLLLLARDPSAEVRRAVAEAAAELPLANGQRAGIPVLKLLAEDADAAVRARAEALLSLLLGASPTPAAAAAAEPPPSTATVQDAGAATAAENPAAEGKPDAPTEAPSGPDAAAELDGLGLLVLKGPDYVQYQLDGKHWVFLPSKDKGQKLPPGPHKLVTMRGKEELAIEEKKTKTVEIQPSPIEEAAHSGIEAYQRKDYGKAGKLLERALQRCERSRGLQQPCNNLTPELFFFLGRVHEEQSQDEDAARAYQQVVDAESKGRLTEKQRDTAAESLKGLSRRLGLLLLRTQEHGKCTENKIWLPPGSHQIKVNGSHQSFTVKAGQKLPADYCK
jgi:HEAT repeat protein